MVVLISVILPEKQLSKFHALQIKGKAGTNFSTDVLGPGLS